MLLDFLFETLLWLIPDSLGAAWRAHRTRRQNRRTADALVPKEVHPFELRK